MGATPPVGQVLDLVLGEMTRAREKFGDQYHLTHTMGPAYAYGLPPADVAKACTEAGHERGSLTWGHILVEEVAEALDSAPDELLGEVVQVAAVALRWALAIIANPPPVH